MTDDYKLRDEQWLASRILMQLKFKVNDIEYEEVLDFDRSLGIFYFDFFGGHINATICLIAEPERPEYKGATKTYL
jgi:hypothetical protein